MQLDPKVSMILNILALVVGVFAMAGWWGDLLGPKTAATVTGIMTTAVAALNVILHAYSPPAAGPLAKALALAAAIGVALALMAPGPVNAQQRPRPAATEAIRTVPGTIIPCDPANLIPGCRNADGTINQTSGSSGDGDLLKKLLSVTRTDLVYAKALADAAATPGAKMRSACWGAWITLLDQQSGANAKDAQGNPLGPVPDPDLFTKIEQVGQMADALAPSSPFQVACQPVAGAIRMSIAQFVSAAVSGGLGLAKFVPGL